MPYVKISSNLQLFYTSNADPTKFDHSRPTILFFHPLFLDSTWLQLQFQDPRLNNNYNLIAFDARSSGRTKSELTSLRDAWVDAADVGLALDILAVPTCHIFAAQMNAIHAAYRYALLFPQKTLSLCLCQIPATKDFDWSYPAYFELLESWCFPPDAETVERACLELGYVMFNRGIISTQLEDDVVAWWEMNFPATKRARLLENFLICISRQTLTDRMMKRIQCPVLVMHGDRYVVSPTDQAEAEAARIPNAQFFIVKGGPEAFTMVPSSATIVNRVYASFLARISTTSSCKSTPTAYKPLKRKALLTDALQNLAQAFDNPALMERTPTSLSFSMISEERVAENKAYFERFLVGESEAITMLGKDGVPTRRASSRFDDQWSEAAFDRTSVRALITGIRGV